MAISNTDLLAKVKAGMGITGTALDTTLLPRTLAVKIYLINAGVSDENIESELGITSIIIGVSDIWNIEPSEASFSQAFNNFVIQLQVLSMPDEEVV